MNQLESSYQKRNSTTTEFLPIATMPIVWTFFFVAETTCLIATFNLISSDSDHTPLTHVALLLINLLGSSFALVNTIGAIAVYVKKMINR